ncbi:hypothetical protein BDW02DRAFT_509928 [Decorospora gaudefroyi]|uniref:F-box domain-containing protein n=1 Tax=Decorospora gaudefroyi TaxID=184978 RepID=A0A6A5JXA7_9PLEO|nr:hypothetical protein BDW02DRAFT_509928 [Decorospora gaudefroyi]
MVTQRRYSVTGQTPPDDMKACSPKLQPLDTGAQTRLCDGGAEAGADNEHVGSGQGRRRGRKMVTAGTVVRTSSKRSATQLPSPNSPSHQQPPKIARYIGLGCDGVVMDVDVDDTGSDSDSDGTDVVEDSSEHEDEQGVESQATSVPSTPEYWRLSSTPNLLDATRLAKLQLDVQDGADDDHMDGFALSPSHSRNSSLDRIQLDSKRELQSDWDAYKALSLLQKQQQPEIQHIENIDDPVVVVEIPCSPAIIPTTAPTTPTPTTFLTLPPEIRHQIYRNCTNLILDKPLVYCISTFTGEIQHPLASVSRLVRSEALAIFYSYNTWVIKVEFRMMYEAFRNWIIRLGDGAGLLRLISFAVRGRMFCPGRKKLEEVVLDTGGDVGVGVGVGVGVEDSFCPPDGDASFSIDLSEKFTGGRVALVRNEGSGYAGRVAVARLEDMVRGLWEKRRVGSLNGQDWIDFVDGFVGFIGGW